MPQPRGPGVTVGQFGRVPLQFAQAFEQLLGVPRQVGEEMIAVAPVVDGQLFAEEEVAPQHQMAAQS